MDKVDVRKTVNKVKEFFKYDYEKYETLSKYSTDLKGVNYDNTKVNSSLNTDKVSDLYIKAMQAKNIIDCVKSAIENLVERPRKPYKTLMTLRYMKHYLIWQVGNKLGYGLSQTNEIHKKALINFADIFLLEQMKLGVPVDKILDLHVYK
ncbi:ArpU family phage packaging/lysis transcriptional regulator [Lactobacillus sp. PSON]|uniref:ArpU family phage packaging/lysis transcriptional regulator n=1 Tax=Lactobacillus sp. PSON TaxID=3455454 RepID=UPI004041E28F